MTYRMQNENLFVLENLPFSFSRSVLYYYCRRSAVYFHHEGHEATRRKERDNLLHINQLCYFCISGEILLMDKKQDGDLINIRIVFCCKYLLLNNFVVPRVLRGEKQSRQLLNGPLTGFCTSGLWRQTYCEQFNSFIQKDFCATFDSFQRCFASLGFASKFSILR